jgi:hypothetical protein
MNPIGRVCVCVGVCVCVCVWVCVCGGFFILGTPVEERGELRNRVTDSSNFMKEFEQVYLYHTYMPLYNSEKDRQFSIT